MKKLFAWLLVLALCLSCCPVAPLQAKAQTVLNQITEESQLVTGEYVLAVDTGYTAGVYENGWLTASALYTADGAVADVSTWSLIFTDTGVVLTDANGTSIAPKGGNNNGITGGKYEWSWSFADGKITFAGTGEDTVVLASNVGSANKFRAYKTTTVSGNPAGYPSQFTLYVAQEQPEEPEVTEPTDPIVPEEPSVPTDPVEPEPEEPTEPAEPVSVLSYVDVPSTLQSHKLAINQVNLGKDLGFTGAMNNYYYATSENIDEMVDVWLENAEAGVNLYFLANDVKTYLNIIPREADATKTNVVLQTLEENPAPTAYHLNTEFRYVYATVNDVDWYLGTYGTFNTISASKTSYIEDTTKIGVSQFPAWFAEVTEDQTPDTPVDPEPEEPTDPTEPTEPEEPTDPDGTVLTILEAIKNGSVMEHNTYTDVKYKVTGTISEVYNTTYGNMRLVDEEGNLLTVYGTYDATGGVRYDAMDVKPVAGDTVTVYGVLGQFNGTPQIKNGWIVEHIPAEIEPEDPTEPTDPVEPEPEEPAQGSSLKLTTDTLGLASNTYYTGTAAVDGVELDLTQIGNYGNGIQMRDKNGNTSVLFNTTALSGKITKVVLTYNSAKPVYNNADALIFSFGDAQDNLTYTTKLSTVADQKEYTIVPEGEFSFFRLEHDLAYSFYWDSIEIFYEEADAPVEPDVPEVVIVGDVNGSENIDVDDALYLLRHVLFPELFPVNQDVDFDGDERITEDDAIYLLNHVLMPDQFPLN